MIPEDGHRPKDEWAKDCGCGDSQHKRGLKWIRGMARKTATNKTIVINFKIVSRFCGIRGLTDRAWGRPAGLLPESSSIRNQGRAKGSWHPPKRSTTGSMHDDLGDCDSRAIRL